MDFKGRIQCIFFKIPTPSRVQNFGRKTWNEGNHLGDLRVFVMAILKQILKKEKGVTKYSGFM